MRLTISAAGVMSFGRIVLHTTLLAGCDCLAWGCCCRGGVFVRSLSGISREAALARTSSRVPFAVGCEGGKAGRTSKRSGSLDQLILCSPAG